MIALPPPLVPWAEEVERLPGDLALGLYPLFARIASALGTLPSSSDAPPLEPEGYAGLSPRGPYHRLLPSEWLLAFELPDEFLRRAANAEQLFFDLARSRGAGSRRALVLFDAGPTQHGAPRVAQIATLIAFARRARLAGATLHFGVLQAPAAGLVHADSSRILHHLLRARSVEPCSGEHARAWSDALGTLQRQDDAWIVGGPDVRALGAFGRWPRIVLEEPLDPARREVTAVLEHPQRPERRVALELPPADDCVQLLRDPYRSASTTPQRTSFVLDTKQAPWFSGDGRRIFAWLVDGSAISYPVPNSTRATAGKPRLIRPRRGEVVLACGSLGRRLLALTLSGGALFLQGRSRVGGRNTEALRERFDLVDHELGPVPVLDPNDFRPGIVYEVDRRIYVVASGQLYVAELDASVLRRDCAVFAVAPLSGNGVLRVSTREGFGASQGPHTCIEVDDGKQLRRERLPERTLSRFHFGYLSKTERFLAIRLEGQQLMVRSLPKGHTVAEFRLPDAGALKGVVAMAGQPCLLMLEDDGRTLSLLGRSTSRTFARANAEVLHAVVSPGSPHLAYLTEAGELVVHVVTDSAPVLRVLAGGTP